MTGLFEELFGVRVVKTASSLAASSERAASIEMATDEMDEAAACAASPASVGRVAN